MSAFFVNSAMKTTAQKAAKKTPAAPAMPPPAINPNYGAQAKASMTPPMKGLDWIKANGADRQQPAPAAPTPTEAPAATPPNDGFASYADQQIGQDASFGMDTRDNVDGIAIMKGPYKGRSLNETMAELRQQYDLTGGMPAMEPKANPNNPNDPRTVLKGMPKRPQKTAMSGGASGLDYLKQYGPDRFADPSKPSISPPKPVVAAGRTAAKSAAKKVSQPITA
jgi:hypothetical protein